DFYFDAFCNFPLQHLQYVGGFVNQLPYPKGTPDLLVQCGARDLGGAATPTIPDKPVIDASARLVAIGMDASMLGRTQTLDFAIVADVRQTLRDLIDAVGATVTAERLRKIGDARLSTVHRFVATAQSTLEANLKKNFDRR